MKTTERELETGRAVIVVFDKGDDVIDGLTKVAKDHDVRAAGITAIGAFEEATLGYFDRKKKDYLKIPVEEQVEVLSLIGDIALKDGEPMIHAHAVLGRPDGSTVGGHVLEGRVWPTLEVVITETPEPLRRRHDDETGLALIDTDSG